MTRNNQAGSYSYSLETKILRDLLPAENYYFKGKLPCSKLSLP